MNDPRSINVNAPMNDPRSISVNAPISDRKDTSSGAGAAPPIGGRTASIVSQLLLHGATDVPGRVSLTLDIPQQNRVGIYTVTREEIGFFHKAIPAMTRGLAWWCLCFNVIFPGTGTFISSFACLKGAKTKYKARTKAFLVNTLAALLQLLTIPILIGFVWSVVWGMKFVQRANETTQK